MKRTSFFTVFFLAIVSVFLFSGQTRRPYVSPQQTQQRQQVPAQQRQATLPKPAVSPNSTPQAAPAATGMPPLFWLPEDIKFPEMPPGGSPTITLFGDSRTNGLYVTRTLIPHGTKTIPHTHTDSRTVTVLSGICYYGRDEEGKEFDESRVIPTPMPPGSFFTEPAGTPHYIWAKDGDVIVQTTSVGPSSTQLVPVRKTER